jgi:protein-S-isoprenylcysteine O-methyltransferase Ste14
MIAGLIFMVFYNAFLFGLFFLSAGSFNFPFAWITLGAFALINFLIIFNVDPDLISERFKFGGQGVIRRDQAIASTSFIFMYLAPLIIAGLDLGRYGWTPAFSPFFKIGALIIFILGNLLGRWAIATNRYFSTFVRIQEDRGHQVVTSGPYRFIRHPGYAGAILSQVVLPLALGSLVAVIPAVLGGIGFIIRTALEDRELIANLDGYAQYAEQVPNRLIPGIW